jgi:hypothetical protein
LLELVCNINNHRKQRTIQAIPYNVFEGLEINKQKIIRRYYPLYLSGTIVTKKHESKKHSRIEYLILILNLTLLLVTVEGSLN